MSKEVNQQSLEFLFLRAQKGDPKDIAAYEDKLRAKEAERKAFVEKMETANHG